MAGGAWRHYLSRSLAERRVPHGLCQARPHRPRCLAPVLGCMSYGVPDRGNHPWTLDEEREPAVHQAGARARHQLLRHRQCLFRRHQRGDRRPRAEGLRAAATRSCIATKVHGRMRPGPNGAGLSRKAIMAEIDASLRRLGTDYVDLYQIHRWDYDDADRGDAGGAARRRQGRQGPLYRRVVDVCLAVRQGAAHRRAARLDARSSRCRTTSTCSTARRSARCCRCARPRASA